MQLAAAKALSLDASWYTQLNEVYRKRREKVFQIMDLLDCEYSTAQVGLFVWAKIPATYKDSYALCDRVLDDARVFVTPGGIFGDRGNAYIRISLCANEEVLDAAIERIQTAITN